MGVMVMTAALTEYLKTLVPAAPDRTLVACRRKKIEDALKASSLGMHRIIESGSFSHGTGIAQKSDVDYMVSLRGSKTDLPSSTLAKMKTVISGADSAIRDVRVASPTVQVTYWGGGPDFEIVPGFLREASKGGFIYDIPGRRDEWLLSSPESHKQYVNDINDQLSKKVKPLIRLVKAWKHGAGAPVSSFYLEMRTAAYASRSNSINFDSDLLCALRTILASGLADMNDPVVRIGRIPACSSLANKATTMSALKSAVASLQAAQDYALAGRWVEYFYAMRVVYPDFPYESGW